MTEPDIKMGPKKIQVNESVNRQLDVREHILLRSEMYMRTTFAVPENIVYVTPDGKLGYTRALINGGLVHLLNEIVSNSADNSSKNGTVTRLSNQLSARGRGDARQICLASDALIDVEITPSYMAVTNYGAPFDIDFVQDGSNAFIPEKCFLNTNFGSNFDDDTKPRIGVGRNGIGAKLVVYCSKYFELTCVDAERGRFFRMTLERNGHASTKKIVVWPIPVADASGKHHMPLESSMPPPEILAYFSKGKSYTRVHWVPDSEEGDVSPDAITQFGKSLPIGSEIVVRRCPPSSPPEEHHARVISNSGTLIAETGGKKSQFDVSNCQYVRHVKVAQTGLSIPPTACIFQGTIGITDYDIDYASRHALDFTLCGIPVRLRRVWSRDSGREPAEHTFAPITVTQYGQMLFGDLPFYSHSWIHKDESVRCEIAFFDTPDAAIQLGFVNGVWANTGIHVDESYHALWDVVKEHPEVKKYAPGAKISEIKKHVSIVVLCIGTNPKQKGQEKTGLTNISGKASFTVTPVPEAEVARMFTGSRAWKAMSALLEAGKNKEIMALKEKIRKVKVASYIPANVFGKSSVLAMAEGDSCVVYVEIMKNQQGENSDRYGIFPIRGVPRNLYGADPADALDNKMFASLLKITGLDIDKKYETEEELQTLKYGNFLFFGDPDLDGFHIIGLMLANFLNYWPALFAQRRVGMYRTPVVRIYSPSGKDILARYYSDREYENAVANGTAPKGEPKRIKGLGTINVGDLDDPGDEILDDTKYAMVVWFDLGQFGAAALHAFFSAGNAALRRDCIVRMAENCSNTDGLFEPNPNCNLIPLGQMPLHRREVESYVKHEIVQYSVGSLFRQIPGAKDLCKDAQRKILAYYLEHNNFGTSHAQHKVEQLVGKIAEKQHYHHGAPILGSTLKRMAVSGFSGANNVPVFQKKSNLGSKLNWPNDIGADRYVFISSMEWMKYAFHRDIYKCVPRRVSEGNTIEPVWIPCDIPFGIMNGIVGMGTGWATYMPPCHPTAVVEYLEERLRASLEGRAPRQVTVPFWYSGFRGSISVAYSSTVCEMPPTVVENEDGTVETVVEDQEIVAEKSIKAVGVWDLMHPESYGKVPSGTVAVLHITEVPPELRLNRLIDIVADLDSEGHVTFFRKETKNGINFHIGLSVTGKQLYDSNKLVKMLKLTASYPLTNFNLLNDIGAPVKFNNIYDYLSYFYTNAVNDYETSRLNQIRELEDDIRKLRERRRYIENCIGDNPKIRIGKLAKNELNRVLVELGFDVAVAKSVDAFDMTPENIEELNATIVKHEAGIEKLRNTRSEQLYLENIIRLKPHLPTCPMPKQVDETTWVSQELPKQQKGKGARSGPRERAV